MISSADMNTILRGEGVPSISSSNRSSWPCLKSLGCSPWQRSGKLHRVCLHLYKKIVSFRCNLDVSKISVSATLCFYIAYPRRPFWLLQFLQFQPLMPCIRLRMYRFRWFFQHCMSNFSVHIKNIFINKRMRNSYLSRSWLLLLLLLLSLLILQVHAVHWGSDLPGPALIHIRSVLVLHAIKTRGICLLPLIILHKLKNIRIIIYKIVNFIKDHIFINKICIYLYF